MISPLRPCSQRRGNALPVAIVLSLVLTALGVYLLSPITTVESEARQAERRMRAEVLVDSGFEVAVHRLATTPQPTAERFELPADAGQVTVEVAAIAERAGAWLITAEATIPGQRPHVLRRFLALELGERPTPSAPRAITAYLRGRTADVAEGLPK